MRRGWGWAGVGLVAGAAHTNTPSVLVCVVPVWCSLLSCVVCVTSLVSRALTELVSVLVVGQKANDKRQRATHPHSAHNQHTTQKTYKTTNMTTGYVSHLACMCRAVVVCCCCVRIGVPPRAWLTVASSIARLFKRRHSTRDKRRGKQTNNNNNTHSEIGVRRAPYTSRLRIVSPPPPPTVFPL